MLIASALISGLGLGSIHPDAYPEEEILDRLLIELQKTKPRQICCLRGNHEEMLISVLQDGDKALWLCNGGDMTLRSYEVTNADYAACVAAKACPPNNMHIASITHSGKDAEFTRPNRPVVGVASAP